MKAFKKAEIENLENINGGTIFIGFIPTKKWPDDAVVITGVPENI